MAHFDLPADPTGPAATRQTPRADSLPRRMGQRTDPAPAPSAAPAGDTPARTGTWTPPPERGPLSYPQPSERGQRISLTPGMRARVLLLISRHRSSRAAADAAGDRRQELMLDLLRARQLLKEIEDAIARTAWANRGKPDPATQREADERADRVKGLAAALDRATAEQSRNAQRAARLKELVASIAGHCIGRRRAFFGDHEPNLDHIEQTLLEGNSS